MGAGGARPGCLHLLALAGLSAAVLAFEVLLLRLFEFSHWHHFAGFAIALALLGLGAAGTVLALAGGRAVRAGDGWFLGATLAAAAAFLLVLWLQSRVAIRPLFAAWDPLELARLLALDLAAFLPFFCAGLAIGQVFPRWPAFPARLYSANLLGSAAGSLGASGLLMVASPETALALVATLLALLATATAVVTRRARLAVIGAALSLLAAVATLQPPAPAVSDFKALSRVLELPDARVLSSATGLRGRLTVVRSDSLRFAPGLSLQWQQPVAPMDAVVVGSDRLLPLPHDYGRTPAHAGASLAGLPPRLRPEGRVLVLGSSAWATPTLAAGRPLTGVEPDPRLLALAADRGADGRFELVADSPARFLASGEQRYALVVLDGAFAGGDAASEDYLLTVEGLARALQRTRADGLLAIPLPFDYPPRQGPRALATVKAALERSGIEYPARHVAALRGLQSQLLLAAPRPLSAADLEAIGDFAERWRFDRAWLPGLTAGQANRHHALESPALFESARALFEGGPLPAAARWFETAPADRGRPYFWRAMRWSRVPELLAAQGRRALSLLDWTLLMSAFAALLVTLTAFALMLLPLGRLPTVAAPLSRTSIAACFTALGIGYMFAEMALFQRAILYLGEPVLAAAVVFALFLGGSGLGAAMPPRDRGPGGVLRIYGLAALGGALAVTALWGTQALLAVDSTALRIGLLALAVLPLTWALGRPLPRALQALAPQPRWLPWAWGINGFASVLGISLAPLVSVQLGQHATLAVAAAAYCVAAALALRWARRPQG
ncbi:MAG: hypothetical protein R3225_08045 [Halofilum sp. (in: g-proteobacteria)]|nr:hypothetical protein [Halofilum sp. (in: g-proteobacteria)]